MDTNGSKKEDVRAWAETATREQLFERFVPLARHLARKYGDGSDDAVADAMAALWSATATYDPFRGSFANWASMYIRSGVERGHRLVRDHVRIPIPFLQKMGEVYRTRDEAAAQGTKLTDWDAAIKTGMQESEARTMLKAPVVTVAHEATSEMMELTAHTYDPEPACYLEESITEWLGEDIPESLRERIDWWRKHDGSERELKAIVNELKSLGKRKKKQEHQPKLL